MKFNSQVYDILKWITQIVMPALIVAINTIGGAVGWPHTELTTTVIGAITIFIGASLGLSSAKYYQDHKVVKERKDSLPQEELEHFFEGK